VKLIEFESKVKEDEIVLLERARMAELAVANRELELKAKMAELEELKHSNPLEAIDKRIAQIQAIEAPLFVAEQKEYDVTRPQRKMGFVANMREGDIVRALYADGDIKEGEKVVSKTKIIDVKSRTQDRAYKEVVKKLSDSGVVEFKRGHGYYAKADYETALSVIGGA